jgi:cytidylate kinase
MLLLDCFFLVTLSAKDDTLLASRIGANARKSGTNQGVWLTACGANVRSSLNSVVNGQRNKEDTRPIQKNNQKNKLRLAFVDDIDINPHYTGNNTTHLAAILGCAS